jgi:dicarboxylate/amino acid:cation (Na+ or H+) symporter, DAACS family
MDQPKKLEAHWKILIGLLVGGILGLVANATLRGNASIEWFATNIADSAGQIFLRLVMMVVVPLVFCALTLGVAGIGDSNALGAIGFRTLIMTAVFSTASVLIGIGIANGLRPGSRLSDESKNSLKEKYVDQTKAKIDQAKKAKSTRDSILDVIPRNPLQEAVGSIDGSSPGSGMLGVMFFSLCFGVALATLPQSVAKPVVDVLEGIYQALLSIIRYAMRLAPYGVCGLVFSMAYTLGFDIVKSLLWYIAAVLVGLSLQMFVVYSIAILVVAKRSPGQFFRDILEVLLTAFGTSSSNATLPTSLRVADEKLRLDQRVSHFVLTIGSTANQNGTALYEGITVLFLAQVFGFELTLYQQMFVVIMSIFAGIGTAGVPGGSLPLVVLVLQQVGIPADGIGIILGVDRLLDMSRTVVNVCGDLAIAACVDKQVSATTLGPETETASE